MSECPNPNCRSEGPHHHEAERDKDGNWVLTTIPHGVIFGRGDTR